MTWTHVIAAFLFWPALLGVAGFVAALVRWRRERRFNEGLRVIQRIETNRQAVTGERIAAADFPPADRRVLEELLRSRTI